MEDVNFSIAVRIASIDDFNGAKYPKGAFTSYDQNGINIHIDSSLYKDLESKKFLRLIQKAGKFVKNQGFKEAELIDTSYYTWSKESSYAFWQGFYNIKSKSNVKFTHEVTEDKDFNKMISIIDWLKSTINSTSTELTPESFLDYINNLNNIIGNRFTVKVYEGNELLEQGFIGTYTVGKGSINKPRVYELDYNPLSENSSVFVSLVGKGITFDTGGYSLKPSEYMKSMHSDMGGSATVAASFAMLAYQGFNKRIKAYLCCAENCVSSSAMKVGDIIKYSNGVSVCIDNTDAEGRLVLADGLIKATNESEYIVDAATLTGSAKVALGRDYNAIFSLNTELANQMLKSSEEEKEYAWVLPFADFHIDCVKSEIADITNSVGGEIPGATSATAFLSHFVKNKSNWVHIDLSASYQKSSNDIYNVGAKGHGARMIVNFIKKLAQ
ncbi:MAG: aminopeptidase PepB [Succinivibrionaceae bacterium]